MELYESLGSPQNVDALEYKGNYFLFMGKLCMLRCFKPTVLPVFNQLEH